MAGIFDYGHLEKYSEHICVIFRNQCLEKTYTYKEVLIFAKEFQIRCKDFKIPPSIGFAIKLKTGHTVSSVAIILSILNHGCYICPLPEGSDTNFIFESTASYFLSDDELEHKSDHYEFLTFVEIDEVKFYLSKIIKIQKVDLPNAMCYTIGTSGTTGAPKMVHVNYDCIAPNIHALCTTFKLATNDVIFFGTPLTFDPSIVELFMALHSGAALLITTSDIRLNPVKLLQVLWPANKNKNLSTTLLQMTPSLFRQFGSDAIKNIVFHKNCSLRILILGGEEFPKVAELRSWLPEKLPPNKRIFNIFGITELSCWATIFECQNFEDCVPLGSPIDNETVLNIDSMNSATEKGELLVGSATRKAFIPMLDKSEHIQDGILFRHTGDLVERNKTNGEIYYIGRLNNTVKRFGQRICLESLERKIYSLLKLQNIIVICLWHETKQQLILCIKLNTSTPTSNNFLIDARREINKNLSKYEKPDKIVEINELPLNKHGKIDRTRLTEQVYTSHKLQIPTEILKNFLSKTLDVEIQNFIARNKKRHNIEDGFNMEMKSFTALGGTSFHALSLATEIGAFLNNQSDQRILLQKFLSSNTTIKDIFHFLEDIENRPSSSKKLKQSGFTLAMSNTKKKTFQFVWRADMKKCIDSTPAVDTKSNTICVGSHSHLLAIFDAISGKEIATLNLRDRIECEVTFVSNELALVGCNAGYIHAFNYRTGALMWSIYVGTKVKAKPLVIDATHVIVGCYDEEFNLISVGLKSQEIQWRKKVGSKPIFSSPLRIDHGTAIVCTLDGTIERFEISTGKTLWVQKRESPIFSTPASIYNGTEFVIAEVGGLITVCKTESGNELFTFEVAGNIFSDITVFKKNETSVQIIFGCHDHNVYCLNYDPEFTKEFQNRSLKLNWICPLNSAVYCTPILMQWSSTDYILVCSTEGLLVLLEASSGTAVASHTLNGQVFSTPRFLKVNEYDLRIYLGCRDNFLYCFKIS